MFFGFSKKVKKT